MIVHTRSHETITYGGTKSGIPCFGFSPIPANSSRDDVWLYNFVREYCEELFSYDDLIETVSKKRGLADWFFDLPEAKELLDQYEKKSLTCEFMGFGIDALNGTATLAVLVIVRDVQFSNRLKHRIQANWEVAMRSLSVEPLEFVEITSNKFRDWLKTGSLHFGSAFTLSRALQRLKALPPSSHAVM